MALPVVNINGTVVSPPEMRFTKAGKGVATLRVATNRYTKTDDGWEPAESCFIDCDSWGPQAELMADNLDKGDRVMITGTLRQDEWEAEDGSKRSKHKVTVQAWAVVPKQNDVF